MTAVAPLTVRGVPSQLIGAYGQAIGAPVARATFLDPSGVEILTTSVTGGTYSCRSDRWPREQASITIASALTPSQTAPPVTPYGGTVRITVGQVIAGKEYTFTLCTLDVTRTLIRRPEGTVEIDATSREARVNEDRYDDREGTAAGATSAILTGLVRRTFPALPVSNRLTSDPALPVNAFPLDGDVWPTVESICDEADAECVFDALGSLVLRPQPVRAATNPVLTFRTGETGPGTLTGYESERAWAFNRVVVVYEEQKGTAVLRRIGRWQDTTSQSGVATPYGRHTYRTVIGVDEGDLPTQARADKAALTLSKRRQDSYRTVRLRTVPAPWITPGDTVGVELLGGATPERLIVVGVAFPLDLLDVMEIDARDPSYTAT